jgi:hypothetical protein
MAESCKEQAERVEETVLQPVDQWVEQQEQRCREEPCNWWTLCANKLICWFVTVLAKVDLWVITIVVRWVYRPVCIVVSLVVGLVVAVVTGSLDILVQAVKDLIGLVVDAFYFVLGTVVFAVLRIVDVVQTALRLQPDKRPLTKEERALLRPIFDDLLAYDAIEVVDGNAGVLSISGRAFTMGFTIYLPSYSERTLVHECVHTWQFQFGGFTYIGNSAVRQLGTLLNPDEDPYDWRPAIDAGTSWYALDSAEAQAKFVDDVWALGVFDFTDPAVLDAVGSGAFFREDDAGQNRFAKDGVNYTSQANAAWKILRTG